MSNIIEMPKLGFDMAEGTLVNWVKKEGDFIEKGEVLAEIETDKATVQVESIFGRTILKELLDVNTTVKIGTPIAIIGEKGEEVNIDSIRPVDTNEKLESTPEKSGKELNQPVLSDKINNTSDFIKASPLAKAIAKENNLDLSKITGSGPEGRIVKRDVEQFPFSQKPSGQKEIYQERTTQLGEDKLMPLTKRQKIIGNRMQKSKQIIPHFYVTYIYNVEFLVKMREKINQDRSAEERVSLNDFTVKATALALRKFPRLNASINEEVLTLHGNINIGTAVATNEGLLTVVCHNADQKTLLQISDELRKMINRVREGKISSDDIEGSTFTISNLGMYGVEEFSAIINPPESAILAVSSVMEMPVVENGTVKAGMRMKATVSVDHRVSDGAEAALFMQELRSFLEEPWQLW